MPADPEVDLRPPPADEAFRAEARRWLADHAPRFRPRAAPASPPTTLEGYEARQRQAVAVARAWQAELAADRWAGTSWPEEFGGRGGTVNEERIFGEEAVAYGIGPGPLLIALAMVAPTLLAHGTSAQKRAHVPAILPWRRGLVPALQRAGGRLRPGRAQHPSHLRRRRLDGKRPEGVDLLRRVRRLGDPPRSHQPGSPQAPRHQLFPARHAYPRSGGTPAPGNEWHLPLQRGLPHRCQVAARQPGRRAR